MTLDPTLHDRLQRFLPPDILDELPDPQAMTSGIRRLNSLRQTIASFLPQYIADNEDMLTGDHGQLRPGTFMFADVSGFTALSELLQRKGGREGIDIFTEVINDFFATMLEILAKSNGQLLKFAGDALLAFFPARAGVEEAPHAIRTGLRMQRAMQKKFQPIRHPELDALIGEHNLELSMSVGVCSGKLFEALVGNDVQRDHVIQGDLPGRAMSAEEAGMRDDVIIDAKLNEAYGDTFDTEPTATPGFFTVLDNFGEDLSDYEFVVPRRRRAQGSAIFDLLEKNLLDDITRQLERVETISRFVAAEVVNKLVDKGDEIEAENRPATVIFTYFDGIEDLLATWGEEHLGLIVAILDQYYSLMQETVTANGGSITRSDPYKKGVKMLITFGAPVAYPDDPERAVTTALEMRRQLMQLNLRLQEEVPQNLKRDVFIRQRFGITHGMVFASEAGWRARREYTVNSDDVNLAARLMASGEMGQIRISERAWQRVSAHFETEALAPIQLKGKSTPTQAYLVKASTASVQSMSATSDTPFVGHDMQILMLTYALQQAKGPRRRQGFAIRGDAGVGKTRMAKHIAAAAEKTGFKVAWANCQIRQIQSRGIWASILEQLLDLKQAKSEQGQRRLLNVRLREIGAADLEPALSRIIFGIYDVFDKRPSLTGPRGTSSQPASTITSRLQPKASAAPKHPRNYSRGGIDALTRLLLDDEQSPPEQPDEQVPEPADDAATETKPDVPVAEEQSAIPNSIVRFLQLFANRTATLIVLDDVHLASATVRNTLTRVINEINKAKLVVLATHEPDPSLTLNMPRKISLSDLDEEESRQMVARVLGVTGVGPRLSRLLLQRTSGRPLFIESLLQLLQTDEHILSNGQQAELRGEMLPETLPDNVRELVLSQFDRLPARERALLQGVSVLGDGFSLDELVAVSDEDDSIQVEAVLGKLINMEILDMQLDSRYRFRHGLAESTIYETLNRTQRHRLHNRAADFWKAQPASKHQILSAAQHMSRSGQLQQGIDLVCEAASQAEQNQQTDNAIELYTRALEVFTNNETLQSHLLRLQGQQS